MNSRKETLIENLYCNCIDNAEYDHINECIAIANFAKAIGGEVYFGQRDKIIMDALAEFSDYLPGGKYELGFNNAAKHFIDESLEIPLSPLTYKSRKVYFDAKGEKYFICKDCCPICRSASRGCPLHCCRNCWASLHKLDSLGRELKCELRVKPLKKSAIAQFIDEAARNPLIPNGKKLSASKGYLHNNFDIALYLYREYELSAELCTELIIATQ
jgi:hypothetical protein